MGAVEQRNASQELVAVVRSDQFIDEIALALPETVSPRRFARIAITAIQQNPDLALCSRDSVFQALLRCAADGLLPDGREAAIVKRGKTDPKASYMPMVDGFKKVASDYGWTLRARVVHENDTFAYAEEPQSLVHTPTPPGLDPGPMVCAYAVATHRDGRRLQCVMTAEEIGKRRAVATTDQVWAKWPAPMWEKTVIRDLFKDLPLGDLDRERMQRVLDADAAFERAAQDPEAALYGRHASPDDRGTTGEEHPAPEQPPQAERAPIGGEHRTAGTSDHPQSDVPASDAAEDAVWEPVDEEGPTAEQIEAAGNLVIPGGLHKGKTLAQMAKLDDGPGWLLTQLRTVPTDNPARGALEIVVRYALPETWDAYQAWLQEQA